MCVMEMLEGELGMRSPLSIYQLWRICLMMLSTDPNSILPVSLLCALWYCSWVTETVIQLYILYLTYLFWYYCVLGFITYFFLIFLLIYLELHTCMQYILIIFSAPGHLPNSSQLSWQMLLVHFPGTQTWNNHRETVLVTILFGQ